jgi:hypothetical protein
MKGLVFLMPFPMAYIAQPPHVQRLAVIVVVSHDPPAAAAGFTLIRTDQNAILNRFRNQC